MHSAGAEHRESPWYTAHDPELMNPYFTPVTWGKGLLSIEKVHLLATNFLGS